MTHQQWQLKQKQYRKSQSANHVHANRRSLKSEEVAVDAAPVVVEDAPAPGSRPPNLWLKAAPEPAPEPAPVPEPKSEPEVLASVEPPSQSGVVGGHWVSNSDQRKVDKRRVIERGVFCLLTAFADHIDLRCAIVTQLDQSCPASAQKCGTSTIAAGSSAQYSSVSPVARAANACALSKRAAGTKAQSHQVCVSYTTHLSVMFQPVHVLVTFRSAHSQAK